MPKHTPIDGPDFLDQYADRLEANGLTLAHATDPKPGQAGGPLIEV